MKEPKTRDIKSYAVNYIEHGFEEYKVIYRRRKIIELLETCNHSVLVEIGCGMEPLFMFLNSNSYDKYYFYEPSTLFYENAVENIDDSNKIIGFNRVFELTEKDNGIEPDCILCASLLHELESPEKMLKDIYKMSSQKTALIVVVPNANSFHRILGKAMGLIKDTTDFSTLNKRFQQNHVFDDKTMKKILQKNRFDIIKSWDFFIKPFSHAQMYSMLKHGIIDSDTLDGLYGMGDNTGFGSELYYLCKPSFVE